ncbi:unnamed protein product [Paramecium sonneborni]|uniref:Phospholipid scramblase n=1 Tax=Paramecium sonneborni TaxID=65129 RepID=A0A8S1QE16_9CILI|nr:unnamed protein product [Paramecium sonneborni]
MQAAFNQVGNLGQAVLVQMNEQAQNLIEAMSSSCLDILGQQDGIFIKQKFELFEALTGFETPNVYKVYPANDQGKKKKQKALFKCKEKSSTCARICLPGNARPFEMKISNYGCKDFQPAMAKMFMKDDKRIVFKFKREYQCTCLCFNRPRLEVLYVENDQNKKLGTIVNPWYFCNIGCHVLDINDNLRYIVEASCCQTYFWCRCPCNSCNKVEFVIKIPNGEVVAHLMKKGKDCCKNMIGDADNFSLIFPKGATKEDKALLLAVTLMMDYMYFEDKQGAEASVGPA